jgi:hypothetical protein
MPRDEDEYRRRIAQVEEAFKEDRQNVLSHNKDLATMQFGSATPVKGQPGMFQGAVDRNSLAQERIAGMQYGPGGSTDRGYAQEDRRTNAIAPAYAGEGALAQARASDQIQETGYNKIFSDKMMNKMSGASPTSLAIPRPALENKTGFMDIDAAMSEHYNKWKPTGINAVDWAARRARNLLFAPGRMVGEGAAGLATADFWNR